MSTAGRRAPQPDLGELLTPPQVAARLGVQLVTLVDWRHRGRGPRWCKIGRLVRYPESLLNAFIADRLQGAD